MDRLRPELRLPVGVWAMTTMVIVAWALQVESAIYGVGFYATLNGVALGLGLTRQPPLSPRTMQTLAWCTAAQLPTMLTLLFDLEGNRNPKKWTPTDRMTVDRSQRPEPRRTEPDAS